MPTGAEPCERQRGFAALLLLLLVLSAGAVLFLGTQRNVEQRYRNAAEEAHALESARETLIAYAMAGGANNKPGALPCPDTSDPSEPGDLDKLGQSNQHCQGEPDPFYRGRVPWHTIDLNQRQSAPDVWYVMDGKFQDDPDTPSELNPSTAAELQLNGAPYAAILILAGDPVEHQDGRPSAQASDYLEEPNSDDTPNFADCGRNEACNDRVRGISVDQLFHGVQQRLVKRVAETLRAYYESSSADPAERYLPYPAAFGQEECNSNINRGQLALRDEYNNDLDEWDWEEMTWEEWLEFLEDLANWDVGDCGGASEVLSAADFEDDDGNNWIEGNGWFDYIVYHVDPECTKEERSCEDATLTVDGRAVQAVVAAAGRRIEALDQDRPGYTVSDYLDDAENAPASPSDEDGAYVTTPLRRQDNDVIHGLDLPAVGHAGGGS